MTSKYDFEAMGVDHDCMVAFLAGDHSLVGGIFSWACSPQGTGFWKAIYEGKGIDEDTLQELRKQYEEWLASKDVCYLEQPQKAKKHQVGGDHYHVQAIQPIDFILANEMDFCEGNIIKYVTRWQFKNGIEDLKKARHYLDFLIEHEEAKLS